MGGSSSWYHTEGGLVTTEPCVSPNSAGAYDIIPVRRGRHTLHCRVMKCASSAILLSQISHLSSFLYLWPHFHLLFVISHSRCSVFQFCPLLTTLSFTPGVITIARLGQEEKGEKSLPLWILISFPGLLTPISFSPTIDRISGHVPQYSDFCLLSPQLPVRVRQVLLCQR